VIAARLARALVLALGALVVAGCASSALTRLAYANTALAYNNLVPLLTWMTDGYVDLSDAQEEWVRSRIKAQVHWHRAHELPRYGKSLELALVKSGQPFTAQDVAPFYRDVRAHYHALVEHTIPDVADFLGGLNEDQAAQLARRFAEDNHKYERDSLRGTPDERRRKRMHRFVGHLEGWVGSLERDQRVLVEEFYAGLPDFSDEILGERRFRQGEILSIVRGRAARAETAAQLKRLLVDTADWRRPEYIKKLRVRDQRMFEFLAALSGTLTDKQRAALQERVRGFIRDVAILTRPD